LMTNVLKIFYKIVVDIGVGFGELLVLSLMASISI
jgi:hypothetical protein